MARGAVPEVERGLWGLLVDKPAGVSSHAVVDYVRYALGTRRVGHTGTLDPFAEGLLVLLVGAATKLAPYVSGCDKTYEVDFSLGVSTDTGDPTGAVRARAAVPAEAARGAVEVLRGMEGPLKLAPPAFAAVKVGGVPAHRMARSGCVPRLEPRDMVLRRVVDAVALVGAGKVRAVLTVSSGTYVRSLGDELGRRMGLPCHVSRLRRLSVGAVSVEGPGVMRGWRVQSLPPGWDGKPRWRMRPEGMAGAGRRALGEHAFRYLTDVRGLLPFPTVATDPRTFERLLHGQKVEAVGLPGLSGPLSGADPGGQGRVAVVGEDTEAPATALVVCAVEPARAAQGDGGDRDPGGPRCSVRLRPVRAVAGPA